MNNTINQLDWEKIYASLNEEGFILVPKILSHKTCKEVSELYSQDEKFRDIIRLERYRFGNGEYRYFKYPLPDIVQQWREILYSYLVPIANQWMKIKKKPYIFPDQLSDLIVDCHKIGQKRPSPLLLNYGKNDYTRLHHDLYGEIAFPFQAVFFLSCSKKEYEGGEFIITEHRIGVKTKATAILPEQGDMLLFASKYKPCVGNKGYYHVDLKHGVSKIKAGNRQTLGIIFHDTK